MLYDKLKKYDVVLASKSPRRKLLMEEMGIDFRIDTKPVDETYPASYPVEKVAQYLSEVKAAAFNQDELQENTIIITADTTVTLGNEILGKPEDSDDAIHMLSRLSGYRHNVITGVTIRSATRRHSFSVTTSVYFKRLSEDEICYYVDNFAPMDKAGAYGIQEWIGHVAIDKIEGSYFNVMGLPTHRLYEELCDFISEKKPYHWPNYIRKLLSSGKVNLDI